MRKIGLRTGAIVVALVLATSSACARSSPSSGPSLPADGQYGTTAAPFALLDQFGRRQRLSDFAGSVVLLTFVDPHCSGICPLTADLMRRTKSAIAGEAPVQLIAIDANPGATSVEDVRKWSARHAMLHDWLFLTARPDRLRRVWAEYGVTVLQQQGDVAHSSAIFLIDGSGRERGIFPIATQSGLPAEVTALAQAVRRIA